MKLIIDTDYCPVRNFDNVCSLCNCECISGEALIRDCPLIRNGGIPLPKGHGDLIDRNALITELETDYHGTLTESGAHLFVGITNYIDDAPTIIEADKENDNGTDN